MSVFFDMEWALINSTKEIALKLSDMMENMKLHGICPRWVAGSLIPNVFVEGLFNHFLDTANFDDELTGPPPLQLSHLLLF